ncbi:MAG TPA: 3-hydroxyacyl-ACP dehydratase [Verrucomicrobia bacterium]|nr:3-hydroxyacyl-ACP dehydratase [Verrucomicrobiota bacterium]
MLAIEEVLAYSPTSGAVRLTVPAEAWFVRADGSWDPISGIEMMAQAAAAHERLTRPHPGSGPVKGLLVGVRKYTVKGRARVGDVLAIHAIRTADFGNFAIMEGRILRGEECLAEAELKFWHE